MHHEYLTHINSIYAVEYEAVLHKIGTAVQKIREM